jgi:ribosomal protein S3
LDDENAENARAAGFNPGRLARIDDALAAEVEAHKIPGAAEQLIAIFMSQALELRLHYRSLMRQLVYQALEPCVV